MFGLHGMTKTGNHRPFRPGQRYGASIAPDGGTLTKIFPRIIGGLIQMSLRGWAQNERFMSVQDSELSQVTPYGCYISMQIPEPTDGMSVLTILIFRPSSSVIWSRC